MLSACKPTAIAPCSAEHIRCSQTSALAMGQAQPQPGCSLLFQFTDEDLQPDKSSCSQCSQTSAACARLVALARPLRGWPSQLLRDVRRLKQQLLLDEDRLDVVMLAAHLSEIGYSVVVRCALGGSQPAGAGAPPGNCFRNLRHEFLFVRCETGDFEGVEFLVDPCFREQFAIPQPTAAFRQLLASVPEEFVGTSMRLQPVVELLCAEMSASFEARGLTTPPWRRPAAVLSKFFPKLVKDISISPAGGASPRAASPQPPQALQDTILYPAPAVGAPLPAAVPSAAQKDSSGVTLSQKLQQLQEQQQQEDQRSSAKATSPDKPVKEAAQQLASLLQAGYHNHGSPTYPTGLQQAMSPVDMLQPQAMLTLAQAFQQQQAKEQQKHQQTQSPFTNTADTAKQPAADAPAQHAGQQQTRMLQRSTTMQPSQDPAQQLQLVAPLSMEDIPRADASLPQLAVKVPETSQPQRRGSGAVSLLSVQLAGTSNPSSPTAAIVPYNALAPSQALGVLQGNAAQQVQLKQQASMMNDQTSGALKQGQAGMVQQNSNADAQAPTTGNTCQPIMLNTCHSGKPNSHAADVAGQDGALGPIAAAGSGSTAAASNAAAATIHINWTGGVIHKVKPRGAQLA